MRTENSLKNVFWTVMAFGINLVVNFVARKIFIDVLGAEYNGLNSLFSSIISILSIAELGIGTTIIYFLYGPLHRKEYGLIKSLMNFYKKCYRVVAGVVLLIGLVLIPFLSSIVGEVNIDVNIYTIYILFLLESVLSYLFSYKRSIIIADQKERITKYTHIVVILLLNFTQIAVLYLTKNYYSFLLLKVLFTCVENIWLSYIANKKYPFIRGRAELLPVEVKNNLNKRMRAMFYHQIGGFVVNGTDNIIISVMFGVAEVGYYNNYYLIVSSILGLVSNAFSGITASVGSLLVAKNKQESLTVYKGIQAINYVMAAYISCTFYVCVQPLMSLWLGGDYLMSSLVVVVLTVYTYLKIMKQAMVVFKNAAGVFYEDRFVPLVESLVNIVASIICAKIFGVSGIIMGTIISTMVLYFGSYPFIVYKRAFGISPVSYFKQHISYLVLTIAAGALIVILSNLIVLQEPMLELAKNFLVSTAVFVMIFAFMLCNDKNFSGIVMRIKGKIWGRRKK